MSEETLPVCPACQSSNVAPIVYGYPSEEMFDDTSIVLGGCCIESDSPEWYCKECEKEWGLVSGPAPE